MTKLPAVIDGKRIFGILEFLFVNTNSEAISIINLTRMHHYMYSRLTKKSNDPNCRYNFHLNQFIHQLNIKVGLIGL